MNDQEYQDEVVEPEKKHGCFFYGCLSVIGLVLLGVIVGGSIYLYGRNTVTPFVENYMNAVDAGEYEAAYAMLGPQWSKTWTLAQVRSFEDKVRGLTGKCTGLTLWNCNIKKMGSAATTATVVYNAGFEKGPVTVTVILVKDGERWLIEGVNYNSPQLVAALKCPHCGHTNATLGDFCSSCGKPMEEKAE